MGYGSMNDPDWMPGMERPAGPVPAEPAGVFTQDMHTRESGEPSFRFLREAADIVSGSRNVNHGTKQSSFAAIAYVWTAYLTSRRCALGPIRPHDVAHMM